jgi:hypothetical protein
MAVSINLMPILVSFLLIFVLCASQATSRSLQEASMKDRYKQWMAQYGRVYKDDAEKAKRYLIFKENVEYIESSNNAGTKSYKLSINEFADLTPDEFRAYHTGYKMSSLKSSSKTTLFRYANVASVPPSMDWRLKGVVAGVKNQGYCGKPRKPSLL